MLHTQECCHVSMSLTSSSTHDTADIAAAVRKVQSNFRGYKTRSKIRAALESAIYIDKDLDVLFSDMNMKELDELQKWSDEDALLAGNYLSQKLLIAPEK